MNGRYIHYRDGDDRYSIYSSQETGQIVGTVVNVVNYGSSDLLQVRLHAPTSSLVWVPFVEAIVPDVDLDAREMFITPPKGLLELNQRSDMKSKKERRLMVWFAS